MNLAIVGLTFVLAVYQASATPAGFCISTKCPAFTVVRNYSREGFVERRYAPSVWVETTRKIGERRLNIFSRLFNYVKGKNSEGKKLKMALPVIGHLLIGNTPGETKSMRFYLGQDIAGFEPPRPTDSDVHIHHDPAMNYYVMGFRTSDWRNMQVWNVNALKLKNATGLHHNEYLAAGYGPRGPGEKYNEIWMHTSSSHSQHHYHHHKHNDDHDHHHGDHDHEHDDEHGHDHGGDHNH